MTTYKFPDPKAVMVTLPDGTAVRHTLEPGERLSVEGIGSAEWRITVTREANGVPANPIEGAKTTAVPA